jgi:hypothetical protein
VNTPDARRRHHTPRGVNLVGGEDPDEDTTEAIKPEEGAAHTRTPRALRRLPDAHSEGQGTTPHNEECRRLEVAVPTDGQLANIVCREPVLGEEGQQQGASPTMAPTAINSSLRASWSVVEGDDTGAPLWLENSCSVHGFESEARRLRLGNAHVEERRRVLVALG